MTNKIIALAGSPKKRGDTGLLLEYAVKGVEDGGGEVELIHANRLAIKPCQGCNTCYKVDGCIYHDDMMTLYDKFITADAFIISSPVYFGSVTGQLKIIIDRCQALWAAKQIAKFPFGSESKPGVFIATAGLPNTKGTRFDSSLEVIKTLGYALDMKIQTSILVADTDRVPITEESLAVKEAYQAGLDLAKSIK